MFVLLTCPSCAGKSFTESKLTDLGYQNLVSLTTRAPRAGEVDGVHYLFRSRDTFEKMLAQGEIIEHVEFAGNYYGTGKASIDQAVEGYQARGDRFVVVIEPIGSVALANELKQRGVPYCIAFIDVKPGVAIDRFIDRFTDKLRELDRAEDINNLIKTTSERMAIAQHIEPHWRQALPYDLYYPKSATAADTDAIIQMVISFEEPQRGDDKLVLGPIPDSVPAGAEAEKEVLLSRKLRQCNRPSSMPEISYG